MHVFRSFAILPAAGQSQRMGAPKLLLPWQGTTLIEHVVAAWRTSRVNELIVVVSPDNEPLAEVCRRLPCRLVVPATPPPEMKASVCRALEVIEREHAPAENDAWLVAPADLPTLSAAAIDAVLAAYDPMNPATIVPCHGSRRGHPVLFPWMRAKEVFALTEAENLKDLLTGSAPREIPLHVDDSFDDLDTPQDYLRLQNRHDRNRG
jgi:molybdenum cofactor cytidylyltransferase